MSFPLKRILKIAAIGVGSGLVPGLGTAAGAALGGVLASVAEEIGDDDDLEKGWVTYAKGLENVEMTNEQRGAALREKIRSDIIAVEKRVPKDREVNAYFELAVLSAKGVPDAESDI